MTDVWTDEAMAAETAARLDNREPADPGELAGILGVTLDPAIVAALAKNADLYGRIFALVEAWGRPVSYSSGWRTRTASLSAAKIVPPQMVANHHTGGNSTPTAYIQAGDPGRGLTGPLANVHVTRDGRAHVLGVGYQNHAGLNHQPCFDRIAGGTAPLDRDLIPGPDGSFSANRWALAIEANGDGGSDDWTAEQRATVVAINAAAHIVCGWSLDGKAPRSGAHKELTKRKPGDPVMGMGDLRREVAALVAEKSAPAPAPTPEPARTLAVKLLSTNARIDTAPDTGRFRWLVRRAAYLALLKREAPSLILFQELNDSPQGRYISMQQYIFGKLTHLGRSCPSKGNRPIGYDKSKWRLLAERAVELSPNGWAHLAHVERDGFQLWLVNVHLSTVATTRAAQLVKLTKTVAGLQGAVVVAGDFNQPTVSLPGFRDAVKVAGKVTNRTARTLHGWRPQKYDGRHIDKVLVRDGDTTKIGVRYLDVILTSPADETDHNALAAGLTLTATPSDL